MGVWKKLLLKYYVTYFTTLYRDMITNIWGKGKRSLRYELQRAQGNYFTAALGRRLNDL